MSARGADKSLMPVRKMRMMVVALLVGLVFGLIGVGEVVEDLLRIDRGRVNATDASGRVVLVAIDDRSQQQLGRWPWPRATQAKILDQLYAKGADGVLLDLSYDFPTDETNDGAFERALGNGRTLLPSFFGDQGGEVAVVKEPLGRFARHTRPSTIAASANWQMAVWSAPYAYSVGGRTYPFAASLLADQPGKPGETFPIDYRYRLESFPRLSAVDVLQGRVPDLRGKKVVMGVVAANLGDQIVVPGHGRMGGVHVHAFATETLLTGRAMMVGFLPVLALALAAIALALRVERTWLRNSILTGSAVAIIALAIPIEAAGFVLEIVPALAALATVTARLAWRGYRERGLVNTATGLPNLNALRQTVKTADRALIVARVINYPQLSAALDEPGERTLVEQIASRLGVGAGGTPIYQGDEGLFAWLVDPGVAIGHHVEALHALFRSPARIGSQSYDLAISFGVELGSARPLTSRLSSALVAADEAASEGLKWKYHDPERMKDSDWKLSLLAQLDQAIDNGEVWVAFQPQLDLKSGQILSAEALARWTHPVKGPISPHEFIAAAETHGRIDRLTMFMLDRAIAAAAEINASGGPFDVAVNLSARTLSRKTLCSEVRGLLERHKLPAERLTLELTETSAMAGDGSDLEPLLRLRDLGVRISIDDYGTGLSTLDYMRKVPASEIKIDQGFIRSMRENRSDLLMVRSTINLAHSLERVVVAEGVEDEKTLDALRQMGCDRIQGYAVGRPMSFRSLVRRLSVHRQGQAA